jgi:hypothetical protein
MGEPTPQTHKRRFDFPFWPVKSESELADYAEWLIDLVRNQGGLEPEVKLDINLLGRDREPPIPLGEFRERFDEFPFDKIFAASLDARSPDEKLTLEFRMTTGMVSSKAAAVTVTGTDKESVQGIKAKVREEGEVRIARMREADSKAARELGEVVGDIFRAEAKREQDRQRVSQRKKSPPTPEQHKAAPNANPQKSRREIYTALGVVAGLVFAAVALPLAKLCIALAILSVIVVAWRRLEHAPLRDPIQAVAVVVFLASIIAVIVSAVGDGGKKGQSAPDPRDEASPGKVITVYNKVTIGPRMREDDKSVFLTTKPVSSCSERGCNISGTRRETGGTYDAAVCRRRGEEITNAQETTTLDDQNPRRFHSPWYYGVRLDGDTFGYVSEVWIAPKERGGLDLPMC